MSTNVVHGIKSPGRKASRIRAVGAFNASSHPSGTTVKFLDGVIYRIGHREPVPGHPFRTQWVGHELHRESTP